jgi:hypothetical protein
MGARPRCLSCCWLAVLVRARILPSCLNVMHPCSPSFWPRSREGIRGLEALRPSPRADTGVVRATRSCSLRPWCCGWNCPAGSAAQIASFLYHRHGIKVSERTVRGQLRRAGLHREALAAEPKTYGRYEAAARTSGGSSTCWWAGGCPGCAARAQCGARLY